jgi:hypothetical protein
MKAITLFIAIALLLYSCSHTEKTKIKTEVSGLCTWEIISGDTVNRTDCGALKQGRWMVTRLVKKYDDIPPVIVKVEEGLYKNNKKEGYWKRYAKSGELIDSIRYKNDTAY